MDVAKDVFSRIYRVSTRNPVVRPEELAALGDLPGLPTGYREYLMTFGRGDLCTSLRILAPEEVLEFSRLYNSLQYCPFYDYRDWDCGDYPLQEEDLRQGVVFAHIDKSRGVYFCAPVYGNLLFHVNDSFVLRPLPGGIVEAVREDIDHMEPEEFRAFPYFQPNAGERRRLKECEVDDEVAMNACKVLRKRWPKTRSEWDQFFVREIEGIATVLPARKVPTERAIAEREERKRPLRERLRDAKGVEKLDAMRAFAQLTQGPIPECDLVLKPAAFRFDYDFELEAEVDEFITAVRL